MTRFFLFGTVALIAAGSFAACVGSDPDTAPPNDDAGTTPDVLTPNDTGTCATACNGVCVDTKKDPQNCGACGVQCGDDAGNAFACVDGRCGSAVVQVAAGWTNACVLLLEGSVWCWGDRADGITGVVDANPSPTPAKLPGLSGVAEIALGSVYGVARRTDGTVATWGVDNDFKYIVREITFPAKVVQITATYAQACGRMDTGAVRCWGISQTASLGAVGTDAGPLLTTVDPQAIGGLETDVVDVSIGNGSSTPGNGTQATGCAVKTDGTVWCWGSNYAKQLGHDPTSDGDVRCETGDYCNPAANPVLDGATKSVTGFSGVRVGDVSACALKQAAVYCWGTNRDGALGNGSAVDSTLYATPTQVPNLKTTTSFNFGWNVAHAIDNEGNVKSWGVNNFGELGIGTMGGSDCSGGVSACRPTATDAPLLAGAKQISIGFRTGIALKGDGTVWTWGHNGKAQLGHPSNTSGDAPCMFVPSQYCNPTPAKLTGLP